MKINKIYISAFGGLKDFTLDLSEGLNVIFGENENGKTTVMSFIRAMFYGTGKKARDNNLIGLRTKYTPMDGSPMGGRIYFEQGGKDYCLERIFNKSDATDKITLTDTATGEKVAVTNEIGNRVFGLGSEAFQKSMFISSERNYALDEVANGDLNARLSSVALTGSEDTSFQKIEKRITDVKEKVLSKTGKAGALAVLRNKREELGIAFERAKNDALRKIQLNEKIAETDEKIFELSKKIRAVKRLLQKKEDAKNSRKLKQYLSLKEQLDELSKELLTPGKTAIDTNFLSKINFCKAKAQPQSEAVLRLNKELETLKEAEQTVQNMSAENAQEKSLELQSEIEKAKGEVEKVSLQIADTENALLSAKDRENVAENLKKPFNPLLLITGILLIICGVAGGLLFSYIFYILAAVGGALSIISFIIKPDNKTALLKVKTEIADIKEKLASLKNTETNLNSAVISKTAELNTMTAILSADKTVREQRRLDIANKQQQLLEAKEKEQALLTELKKALDGIEDDEENLKEIEKKAEIQKDIKLRLNYLSKDLGGISYAEAEEKLKSFESGDDLSGVDFDKAEAEAERMADLLLELNRQKAEYDTELKTSFRNSAQPEIIEREMKELDEKIANCEDFVNSCEMCLEVMSESFASIRRGYGAELNDKTIKNFARLTGGKYKTVTVNKSLQMEVEQSDSFGMFQSSYLSTGTEDQAFLALRLAICEMISDRESYPIFLDDALSNYDDNRLKIALEFLKEFAGNSQVVLFTCHGNVAETAKTVGTTAKPLK